MTNKQPLDSRSDSEKQADAELTTMVKLETRSWDFRRKDLESDFATAQTDGMRKWLRKEIGRCDLALLELGAGRLPEFRCP